jgi:hypothetical protein
MPEFIDHSGNSLHDARYSRVYLSDALVTADEWQLVDKLYCTELVDSVSPAMPFAKLVWHCGDFSVDFDGALNVTRKPYNLNRVYCKIEILSSPSDDGQPPPIVGEAEPVVEYTWFGSIEFDEFTNTLANTNPPNTDQVFTAYGLARDLESTIVDSAVLVNDAADDVVRVPRGLVFNPVTPTDQPGVGNQHKSTIDATSGLSWVFQNAVWDGTEADKPHRWDAYTAADHLLTHHAPQKADGTGSTCQWVLDGLDDPLADDHPLNLVAWYDIASVATDRRSVKEILDELIDRRRFVGWCAYGDDSGENFVAKVKVFSFSVADIELTDRAAKIAKNGDLVPLTLTDKPEIRSLDVSNNETQRYDEILVEGEPITTTFTAFVASGGLSKGWSTTNQTAYKDGASNATGYGDLTSEQQTQRNAAVRMDDSLQDVFSRFVFDSTFHGNPTNNGTIYDQSTKHRITVDATGLGQLNGENVSDVFDSSAGLDADQWWSRGARVLPFLPITDDDANRYREPICLFRVEEADPAAVSADVWQYGEHLNADGQRSFSVSLRPLTDALGVRVDVGQAGGQQMIAKDDWSGAAATLDALDPTDSANNALHYDEMLCTIAVEWDRRAYHREQLSVANITAAKRVRHVYIPDARLDVRLPGTATGVQSSGVLDVDTTGTVIRDDRERLKDIAKSMREWYGVKRQSMSLTYGKMTLKIRPKLDGTTNPDPVRLGSLVTKIGVNISRPEVNSPITSIRFNLDQQEVTISTNYYEGDFV